RRPPRRPRRTRGPPRLHRPWRHGHRGRRADHRARPRLPQRTPLAPAVMPPVPVPPAAEPGPRPLATFGPSTVPDLPGVLVGYTDGEEPGVAVFRREAEAEHAVRCWNEAARLRAENARLREALEDLLSEQNDAPLERRREQWQSAVDAGWAALKS